MVRCNSEFHLGYILHFQLEWVTAGDCMAGLHEVIVTKKTVDAIKAASEANRSLWRVSSTVSKSDMRLHF